MVVVDLMLRALLLCRPGLVTHVTLKRPVIGAVHVLIACILALEPSVAGFALVLRRLVPRRAAVVVPGPPAGWEGPTTGAALEFGVVRHDVMRGARCDISLERYYTVQILQRAPDDGWITPCNATSGGGMDAKMGESGGKRGPATKVSK